MKTALEIEEAIASLDKCRDPRRLGPVLSDLKRLKDPAFFNPWSPCHQSPVQRGNAYSALAAKVGPRYASCTFENYRVTTDMQRRVYAAVCAFAEDMPARLKGGGGVTLFGPPGVGKDHLLCSLMYFAVLAHGYTVEWVNGLDLYEEIRERIGAGENEKELIRRYQAPLILVVSDPVPPKGEISRYNADVLYRIIDRRYRDLKSTWASMNVDGGDEACDRIAANLVDRLKHNSLTLHCDWKSYRSAAA